MSLDKNLELTVRGTEEIVTEEELRELFKGGDVRVYCGYEPSGNIHFGHALTAWKLMDFQEVGADVTVLFADLHAFLNSKGSLEKVRKIADFNKECLIALGLNTRKTKFVLGSDFQLKPEFYMDVLKLSVGTTIARARRSMAMIARNLEDPDVAQVLYPIMQAVDIVHLGVNVAVGGIDQRKVHMIAREKVSLLNYNKPVCIHTPLLHGLDGQDKMSSSKYNFIALDDTPEKVKDKISKAYCPAKTIENNPVMECAAQIIIPRLGTLRVERPEKYGGNIEIISTKELEEMYVSGKLHPADLKAATTSGLIEILAPVTERLGKN